jgi:hypothetical protein
LSIGEDFLKNPPFPTSMLEYGESLKKTIYPLSILSIEEDLKSPSFPSSVNQIDKVWKVFACNLPLYSRLIEVGKRGIFF